MRAYISVSPDYRKKLSKEFIALGMALSGANTDAYIFTDKHQCQEDGEQEYLAHAMQQIDASNFVITEATHPSVLSCIELSYAKARKKPIVYIQHTEAKVEKLMAALGNFHILYESPKDLFDQMTEFLKNVLPQ
ncbi:hypothetical protein [Avrilella dinanensis]|uniref:Nucleoside 2-deoxyribosyltransferase n=1 Tax=Avrilella dinanensis TaxID=2008672 RepID=A0A2M9R777_9FLAO|nr:hypothetical protein [Avrilella dinanensis]PJR04635.1 hypothetical protein CDL10_08850 [Avrilella dinanensis]